MSLEKNLLNINLQTLSKYPHLPISVFNLFDLKPHANLVDLRLDEVEIAKKLSDNYEFSITDLISRKISFSELDLKFQKKEILAEKYNPLEEAYASTKTIRAIRDYLNAHIRETCGDSLLYSLNTTSQLFDSNIDKIHPQMVLDALSEVAKIGVNTELLSHIGRSCPLYNGEHHYGKVLHNLGNARDVIEFMHEEVIGREYDNLFHYNLISSKDTQAVVEITQKSEAHQCLKTHLIGNRPLCLYKQGVYLSFLKYTKLQAVELKESSCLYHGDKSCTYHLTWNQESSKLKASRHLQ